MPVYIYQNPKTKKIIEVVQSIHVPHEYYDDKGLKWDRVFTTPQVNTDGTLEADCSEKQFAEFTKNKKGTIGDLWDRSKELSEKRAKIYGEDPIKKQYKEKWSKQRKNRKPPKEL